jgi:hypothetical protein
MARTGPRMKPILPSPSKEFRTVSFAQHGFKASLSGPACAADITVKPIRAAKEHETVCS